MLRKRAQLRSAGVPGFQQAKDPLVVLGTAGTEGNDCEVACTNHAYGNTFELHGLRIFQSVLRERAEHRYELHRPLTHANRRPLSVIALFLAILVDATQRIQFFPIGDSHQYIDVYRKDRFRVTSYAIAPNTAWLPMTPAACYSRSSWATGFTSRVYRMEAAVSWSSLRPRFDIATSDS